MNRLKVIILLLIFSLTSACGQPLSTQQINQLAAQTAQPLVITHALQFPSPTYITPTLPHVTVPPTGTPSLTLAPPAQTPTVLNLSQKQILRVLSLDKVDTLDPALVMGRAIVAASEMFVGLTRVDEETLEVLPGMAVSWTVSQDGLTWTFNLRRDIPWVQYNLHNQQVERILDTNGAIRYVTAQDFRTGILRVLGAETYSPYAHELFVIAGAQDFYYKGADFEKNVGVEAPDDHTLILRLNSPVGYLDMLADLPFMAAQPGWQNKETPTPTPTSTSTSTPSLTPTPTLSQSTPMVGTEAPGIPTLTPPVSAPVPIITGIPGYGPFVLKEWRLDSYLVLVKNPFWSGTKGIPAPVLEEVKLVWKASMEPLQAYIFKELDVLELTEADLKRVQADSQLKGEWTVLPGNCTVFYGFNTHSPPFDDARIRLAFSLAVDRQGLVEKNLSQYDQPATRFGLPWLRDAPTSDLYPDLGIVFQPERAKELLNQVYPDPSLLPSLSLATDDSEASVSLAQAVIQYWEAELGVKVNLQALPAARFTASLNYKSPPQIWLGTTCLQTADTGAMLENWISSSSTIYSQATKWSDEEFDQAMQQAALDVKLESRMDSYARAEYILVQRDAVLVPLYWDYRVAMTDPSVHRTYSKISLLERFEKWAIINAEPK